MLGASCAEDSGPSADRDPEPQTRLRARPQRTSVGAVTLSEGPCGPSVPLAGRRRLPTEPSPTGEETGTAPTGAQPTGACGGVTWSGGQGQGTPEVGGLPLGPLCSKGSEFTGSNAPTCAEPGLGPRTLSAEGQLWVVGAGARAGGGQSACSQRLAGHAAPPCRSPKAGRVGSQPGTGRQSGQCPVCARPPSTHSGGEERAGLSSDLGRRSAPAGSLVRTRRTSIPSLGPVSSPGQRGEARGPLHELHVMASHGDLRTDPSPHPHPPRSPGRHPHPGLGGRPRTEWGCTRVQPQPWGGGTFCEVSPLRTAPEGGTEAQPFGARQGSGKPLTQLLRYSLGSSPATRLEHRPRGPGGPNGGQIPEVAGAAGPGPGGRTSAEPRETAPARPWEAGSKITRPPPCKGSAGRTWASLEAPALPGWARKVTAISGLAGQREGAHPRPVPRKSPSKRDTKAQRAGRRPQDRAGLACRSSPGAQVLLRTPRRRPFLPDPSSGEKSAWGTEQAGDSLQQRGQAQAHRTPPGPSATR